MTSLVHSNVKDNALVCICCASQSDVIIKYSSCKHTGFLLNYIKSEIECKNMYICNICHNMLKKIEVFKQQVEESIALLLNQVPILKINKLHDLQSSATKTYEAIDRQMEIEIKIEPEYMEVEPDVKFDIDSSDNDTEPVESKRVKKEKEKKKKVINDSSMPRCSVPSYAQVEMLLSSLAENKWLATGYARTSHARARTRKAWQEIAAKLKECDGGGGCNKDWQQWAKYWKDKKSAVKKKASQIQIARRQTGGVSLDEGLHLSAVEEKIVQIMGGERFSGERDQEIETIQPFAYEPGPRFNLTPDTPEVINEPSDATVVVQPGPSSRSDNTPIHQPKAEQMFEARTPPTVPHKSNPSIASPSTRRRRLLTARRRRCRLSASAQIEILTKRFIALEERRLDNQQQRIENQRRMIDVFKEIGESWSKQTQALHDLCVYLRRDS